MHIETSRNVEAAKNLSPEDLQKLAVVAAAGAG